MKKKPTKILVSLVLCMLFAIVVHLCFAFICSTGDNIIIFFLVRLLSYCLCLSLIGLCIWIIYKIWYIEEKKKQVLILSAIFSPIAMYILGLIVLITCFALGVSGGF